MSDRDEPGKERVRLRDLPASWKRVSPYRGALDIAWIWLAIGTVVAVCGRSHSALAVATALPIIGALQNHISSLAHHAIHTNLHPNRTINDWMARALLTAPLGFFLGILRKEHLVHHARLGAADDPERFYYDLTRHGRGTPAGLIRWMVGLLAGWVILPALRRVLTGSRDGGEVTAAAGETSPAEGRDSTLDMVLILLAQAVLAVLFFRLSGVWWAYPVFWLLPAVTFGGGLTVLRATLEHADTASPPRLLMSFQSNPVERFFVGPLNFNYHYEHHRFMTVPYYHVARLRRLLIERDDFTGLLVPSYCARVAYLVRSLGAAAR